VSLCVFRAPLQHKKNIFDFAGLGCIYNRSYLGNLKRDCYKRNYLLNLKYSVKGCLFSTFQKQSSIPITEKCDAVSLKAQNKIIGKKIGMFANVNNPSLVSPKYPPKQNPF
jgi:hypothetical protein